MNTNETHINKERLKLKLSSMLGEFIKASALDGSTDQDIMDDINDLFADNNKDFEVMEKI